MPTLEMLSEGLLYAALRTTLCVVEELVDAAEAAASAVRARRPKLAAGGAG